jgi:hypothetical protein
MGHDGARQAAVDELAMSVGGLFEEQIFFPEPSPVLGIDYASRLKNLHAATSKTIDTLSRSERQLIIACANHWEAVSNQVQYLDAGYDHYFWLPATTENSPVDCAELLLANAPAIHKAKEGLRDIDRLERRGIVVAVGSSAINPSSNVFAGLPSAEELNKEAIDRVVILHTGTKEDSQAINLIIGDGMRQLNDDPRGDGSEAASLARILQGYKETDISWLVKDVPAPAIKQSGAIAVAAAIISERAESIDETSVQQEDHSEVAWEEVHATFPHIDKGSLAASIAISLSKEVQKELHCSEVPQTAEGVRQRQAAKDLAIQKYLTFSEIYQSIKTQLEDKQEGHPVCAFEIMVSRAVLTRLLKIQAYDPVIVSDPQKYELTTLAEQIGLAFNGQPDLNFNDFTKSS